MLSFITVWKIPGTPHCFSVFTAIFLAVTQTIYLFLRDPAETVLNPIEFELDDGPAIEEILSSYPLGVTISDLPHNSEDMDDKVEVARALFREGFLMVVDEATKPADEKESSDEDCPF